MMYCFVIRKMFVAIAILLLLNQSLAHKLAMPKEKEQVQQLTHNHPEISSQSSLIRDKSHVQDKTHIKEHLQELNFKPDFNEISEKELEFYYFKMHDNDGNNKLDGCELIKSVLHWHEEQSQMMGAPPHPTIMSDWELSMLVNPILDLDDTNQDGFIDYAEFVAAQTSRGF